MEIRRYKPGTDVWGWVKLLAGVGVLWIVALLNPIKDYYLDHGWEFSKLVGALLLTVIVWMAHIWKQSRSWEDYGEEMRQRQATHDIEIVDRLVKITGVGKLDQYNIGLAESDGPPEIMGG